jgi:tetratricopeptide (TPR) repeat protein
MRDLFLVTKSNFLRTNVPSTVPALTSLRRPMIARTLAVLVFCGGLGFSQTAKPALPKPEEAPQSSQLDGRLGLGAVSETDKRIVTLQNQVKEAPEDATGYDRLGAAYLQKARENGDVAYYELAEQTLGHALTLAKKEFSAVDTLVNLSLVYMGEHRFADALSTAQQAISTGAGNLAAFAIEGDAYTDVGEYEKAASAYATLRSFGATISSPLNVEYMANSRVAYLKFLEGDTAESIRLLKQAVIAGMQLNLPKENLAWLDYELGERYFQAGDLGNAAKAFSAALASDANHYRSLAGLAKVRAAQGQLDESIRLYKLSINIVPFPQYLAELGDVYLKSGDRASAQQEYDLVEYIAYLSQVNQALNNRELALFYADREMKLAQALQLARKEFEVRHDVYTWDTLAWVLYKNQQFAEAARAMEKALALHTNDSILLFHAGMIEHALGDDEAAENDLSRAVRINPHFHIFYAEQAMRTLDEIASTRQMRASHETR